LNDELARKVTGSDRHAAYQQRAAEIHACITHYSGQPLREMPV
jgi:hypothetical protein